jgi:hypothetical protein
VASASADYPSVADGLWHQAVLVRAILCGLRGVVALCVVASGRSCCAAQMSVHRYRKLVYILSYVMASNLKILQTLRESTLFVLRISEQQENDTTSMNHCTASSASSASSASHVALGFSTNERLRKPSSCTGVIKRAASKKGLS